MENNRDLRFEARFALKRLQLLVGNEALVEPPLLRNQHVGGQRRQVVLDVVEVSEFEAQQSRHAVHGRGNARLAAAHAITVLVVRAVLHCPRAVIGGGGVVGAKGGAAADDGPIVLAPTTLPAPQQRCLDVAPLEDELVAGRQREERLSSVRQIVVEMEAVLVFGGDFDGGRGGDDTHCGVLEGDVNDLEGAVAIEQQPRWLASAAWVVAGEVEAWTVAVGRAHAEWVRHHHVSARTVANISCGSDRRDPPTG